MDVQLLTIHLIEFALPLQSYGTVNFLLLYSTFVHYILHTHTYIHIRSVADSILLYVHKAFLLVSSPSMSPTPTNHSPNRPLPQPFALTQE